MYVEDKVILLMIQGYSVSCIIYAACELGIMDALYDNKMTRKQLNKKIKGDDETIGLIIDALIVNGIIEEKNDILENTKVGRRLAVQEQDSLKDLAIFTGRECIPSWLKIADAIKNHSYPFKELNNSEFFEDIKNSDRSESFVKMMGSVSKQVDFSSYLKLNDPNMEINIVDVGGGTGEIISKFLKYFTKAKGLILDLEHVKDRAKEKLKKQNLLERCDFQEGNFFESYNVSGDIFILSRVLHDWTNKEAELILNNIKNNMNHNSKLLIIEKIIPDIVEKKNAALFTTALHIWTICGGRERSQKQYDELLDHVGMSVKNKYYLDNGNYLLEVVLNEQWDEGIL